MTKKKIQYHLKNVNLENERLQIFKKNSKNANKNQNSENVMFTKN